MTETPTWRLIREERRPGPLQMALDEVAAETAAAGGPATIRTYRWDPDCLTLGYGQDPDTVDWTFCDREAIDVTRRQTGGGGIYHDGFGDVAYSIVVPAAAVPGKLLDCYHQLCEPILAAFDRLGIDADYVAEEVPELYHPACYLRELHPAHDIIAAGRKIAGNAQYRKRDAVVQHGSLTYSVDAERHLGVFVDPPVDVNGFRERVVGMDELVDVDRASVVRTVAETLAEWARDGRLAGGMNDDDNGGIHDDGTTSVEVTTGSWTDAELERARELVEIKYTDDAWVRARPGDRR
ncbi:lipoate--protein ligase family protein [Halorubrum vacuolatum]|uniref:Lipoate-protein ligase A n=1 Tax=Halorubrum vacuolatum TaxID=63740 RepID=A0A238VP04_HALVU|nr:biotin/lipoate A/B protein ligase family protein [Halorubrum vacuolatum]SNR36092.1 lipoate-protein ligase A [Halorubrum vacuolatum]